MAIATTPETKPTTVDEAFPKTCLTVGYISLIATLIGFLACIGIGMDNNINFKLERTDDFQTVLDDLRVLNVLLYIALTILPICFFFSGVLIAGVMEKDAQMLKLYSKFGIVVSILCCGPCIFMIRVNHGNGPWFAYVTICFMILVYLPVIGAIRSTSEAYAASKPDTTSTSSATTEQHGAALAIVVSK